jgi:hypothetical protein
MDYETEESSPQEEFDLEVEEIIDDTLNKPGYYKSKKGDADQRKQTSKANAAKARAAKIAKSKQMKKTQEYAQQFEYEEGTDDSSSEEEFKITRKPPTKARKTTKQAPKSKDAIADRLGKLEGMIAQIATKGTKLKKRVAKKTVIHNHINHPRQSQTTAQKTAFMIDLID